MIEGLKPRAQNIAGSLLGAISDPTPEQFASDPAYMAQMQRAQFGDRPIALQSPALQSPAMMGIPRPNPEVAQMLREKMQAAPLGLLGANLPDEIASRREFRQQQQEPEKKGFLSGLKNFVSDPAAMAQMAIAFNSMRLRPDQGLATILGNRLSTIQKDRKETRKSNRTADVLLERGLITPDQAEMIRLGLAEQAFGTDKFSRILEMMKTPEGMAQLQQLKDLGALGGGTTVQIGGEQQTELDKMLGKKLGEKVYADFDAGTQARQALDSLDTLMGLSEGLDTATSIPAALRGLVPEGISDPLDAYRGVMTNVAKSLRIKGEGTMSDRDIDLLIRQAGPATSNLQARRIMQQTLKNKAQINLELSKLANQFMLGNMTREQYLEQVNVLNNTPAMNEEMRKYISALGGDQKPAVGQVKVISVE